MENFTISSRAVRNPDDFAALYKYQGVKIVALVMYLHAIIFGNCLNGFLVWFEFSGTIGHYRTVINQLTSSLHFLVKVITLYFHLIFRKKYFFSDNDVRFRYRKW